MNKVSVDSHKLLDGNITRLREIADEIENSPLVRFDDLFPPEFISAHTNCSTIQEFFDAGGYEFDSQEHFDSLPIDTFDAYVVATTSFGSWKEMLDNAGMFYLKKKLNL